MSALDWLLTLPQIGCLAWAVIVLVYDEGVFRHWWRPEGGWR